MNNLKLNLPGRHRYAGKAGLAALVVAASMTVASPQAMAAVTCFNTPIPVPQNTAGVYINLFTGASGITAAGTPDWDFNPWGATNLGFFSPGAPQGHVAVGTVISNLATGTLVDGASIYTGSQSSAANMTNFRSGVSPGYVGVRFQQAAVTYYAWVSINTTSPNGTPATVNGWCFENTAGTGIRVGTTPVSLQQFSVE